MSKDLEPKATEPLEISEWPDELTEEDARKIFAALEEETGEKHSMIIMCGDYGRETIYNPDYESLEPAQSSGQDENET
ncbi:hypothetical protein IID22_04740 [Patescibacteria group bacterium]|nr:hypothetical protein [Patescibacteria group bacterium]